MIEYEQLTESYERVKVNWRSFTDYNTSCNLQTIALSSKPNVTRRYYDQVYKKKKYGITSYRRDYTGLRFGGVVFSKFKPSLNFTLNLKLKFDRSNIHNLITSNCSISKISK